MNFLKIIIIMYVVLLWIQDTGNGMKKKNIKLSAIVSTMCVYIPVKLYTVWVVN